MRVVKILSSKPASNERKNTKNIITKNITKKDINNIIFVFLVIRLFNKITKLTIIYIIKKFILFLFYSAKYPYQMKKTQKHYPII